MKIIKYDHACFLVEMNTQRILIDPGNFTENNIINENILAVIITHHHPDHFDLNWIENISQNNQNLIIYCPKSVASSLPAKFKCRIIENSQDIEIGPFHLNFYLNDHAIIMNGSEKIANLSILINNDIYYPGDSFFVPDRIVKTLMLPISAPWLKINETMEFVNKINAKKVCPTHDAILSEKGKKLLDQIISPAVNSYGGEYIRIKDILNID